MRVYNEYVVAQKPEDGAPTNGENAAPVAEEVTEKAE